MEAGLCVVGCGLGVAVGSWLVLPRGAGGARASVSLRSWDRTLLVVAGHARACLSALGGVRALGVLARGWPAWGEAVGEVTRRVSTSVRLFGRREATGLLACGLLASAILGLLMAGAVGAVVCLAGSLTLVQWWSATFRERRAAALARQVPDAFRSLAAALGSGKTLAQAISYVGTHLEGELGREFGRASLAVACGASAPAALDELAERVRAPGVELMVCALTVSSRTGAPLQGLFLRSADLAERRFALRRELEAKTAQARLSSRIVCVLPAGLIGALALLSPDFRLGLATPVGAGCVAAAVALDALALLVIRKILRGVM